MPKLSVKIADRPEDVDQALRLRYRVFAEEGNMAQVQNANGIERDEFDDHCDHLIVRDEDKGLVVGVYRMLPGSRVRNGRLYTSTEFDLGGFTPHIPQALEIGRSCTHPEYRSSATILQLWRGMLGYFARGEFIYLMGCASMRTCDPQVINTLYSYFHDKQYQINQFGIRPRPDLKVDNLQYIGKVDDRTAFTLLPTLIKGYLRLGSEVVTEPIYDPVFQTHDFCMIMSKCQVADRYYRHFMASTGL